MDLGSSSAALAPPASSGATTELPVAPGAAPAAATPDNYAASPETQEARSIFWEGGTYSRGAAEHTPGIADNATGKAENN